STWPPNAHPVTLPPHRQRAVGPFTCPRRKRQHHRHRHTKTTHRRIPEGGHMNDDEFICGENWDHDLEFEYDDDGSWVANCRECGAELWGDGDDRYRIQL